MKRGRDRVSLSRVGKRRGLRKQWTFSSSLARVGRGENISIMGDFFGQSLKGGKNELLEFALTARRGIKLLYGGKPALNGHFTGRGAPAIGEAGRERNKKGGKREYRRLSRALK